MAAVLGLWFVVETEGFVIEGWYGVVRLFSMEVEQWCCRIWVVVIYGIVMGVDRKRYGDDG